MAPVFNTRQFPPPPPPGFPPPPPFPGGRPPPPGFPPPPPFPGAGPPPPGFPPPPFPGAGPPPPGFPPPPFPGAGPPPQGGKMPPPPPKGGPKGFPPPPGPPGPPRPKGRAGKEVDVSERPPAPTTTAIDSPELESREAEAEAQRPPPPSPPKRKPAGPPPPPKNNGKKPSPPPKGFPPPKPKGKDVTTPEPLHPRSMYDSISSLVETGQSSVRNYETGHVVVTGMGMPLLPASAQQMQTPHSQVLSTCGFFISALMLVMVFGVAFLVRKRRGGVIGGYQHVARDVEDGAASGDRKQLGWVVPAPVAREFREDRVVSASGLVLEKNSGAGTGGEKDSFPTVSSPNGAVDV